MRILYLQKHYSYTPGEDTISALYVNPVAWSFWSVYDGHVGPQTAWHLGDRLLEKVSEALWNMFDKNEGFEVPGIYTVIKHVFLSIDDELVNKSAQKLLDEPEGSQIKTLAASVLQEARSGSCALVSFYEAYARRLHVSVVGDSRAILGRRRKDEFGQTIYDVHVLSVDHTADNPAEIARLTAAHPDEPHLFEGGRFLGWGITRAFGSGAMKWGLELQSWMEKNCLGDKPRATCQTPPYFTAEPEITTTDIQPGDFLIMGSDGLWDCLTNEEAVGLVGLWLQRNNSGVHKIHYTSANNETHYNRWGVKKQFVNVDSNVARHLARNALGGADKDLNTALLSTPAPRARHFRHVRLFKIAGC
ncbi:phosphatase 2C-like domain-containing protein [Mycena pura]|uniref:Phosphatase 2C-like domain-containing protein n=1 Tax=Mycena pura TaxID=153505 RepID=A0AAD6VSC8_9AGAR|nr:phosphatase 2C-like domain-containing protein [Mycena pura]